MIKTRIQERGFYTCDGILVGFVIPKVIVVVMYLTVMVFEVHA